VVWYQVDNGILAPLFAALIALPAIATVRAAQGRSSALGVSL
jgi:hypothetical protein